MQWFRDKLFDFQRDFPVVLGFSLTQGAKKICAGIQKFGPNLNQSIVPYRKTGLGVTVIICLSLRDKTKCKQHLSLSQAKCSWSTKTKLRSSLSGNEVMFVFNFVL